MQEPPDEQERAPWPNRLRIEIEVPGSTVNLEAPLGTTADADGSSAKGVELEVDVIVVVAVGVEGLEVAELDAAVMAVVIVVLAATNPKVKDKMRNLRISRSNQGGDSQ